MRALWVFGWELFSRFGNSCISSILVSDISMALGIMYLGHEIKKCWTVSVSGHRLQFPVSWSPNL